MTNDWPQKEFPANQPKYLNIKQTNVFTDNLQSSFMHPAIFFIVPGKTHTFTAVNLRLL